MTQTIRQRLHRRALTLLLVALPVLGVDASVPESVPFRLGEDGAVIVPVFVDGRGPFPFLLDTGASASMVLDELAGKLSLPPVATALVVTPVGSHESLVVRLRRVSLGSAQALELLASVAPASRFEVDGTAIQGVLGQDFLSAFDYTLDYRRRRILWGAPGGPSPGGDQTRLKLRRSEGRFLVELPQEGDRLVCFVPDTGTNGLVVFDRPGAWALPAEPLPVRYDVRDSSGRRAVEARLIRALRVGHLTVRDQVAAVVSRPRGRASDSDGLLPLHLFASVTFESREGYLVVRAR